MSLASADRRVRRVMELQTESDCVGVHREIVEHHIDVVVFPAYRAEPAEVRVRVGVAIHRLSWWAPMETEICECVVGRLFVVVIDGMHKVEVLSQMCDDASLRMP